MWQASNRSYCWLLVEDSSGGSERGVLQGSSHGPHAQVSLFLEAKFDLTLSAVHVPRVDNGAADSLSRNNLDSFFHLVPQAHRVAHPVLAGLVSQLVVEGPWTSDIWKAWLGTLSTP